MLRDERIESIVSTLKHAIDRAKAEIWTSLPVIVESYDAATQQVVVRPAIQARQRMPDDTYQNVTISLLPPIPVKHPRAGGVTMTMPIKAGDEGTIQVCSRCIDGWYANGGIQAQTDFRMHDLSDSFYLPGGSSVPNQLQNVSATTCQLRTDDGTMTIDFDPANKAITITAPNPIIINGDVHVTGKITATQEITAMQGGSDQVTVTQHTHSGVQTGAGHTGKPDPNT